MGIFSFLKPKKQYLQDYSRLKVDLHSHLIPGIDDGAPDMATSLHLIRELHALGFEKIITTPHVMMDGYRNTSETILRGRDQVREALEKEGLDIEFDAAAEYMLDEGFEVLLKKGDLLTFGEKCVLFELPFMNEPQMLYQMIFEMKTSGYQPILAHPERYLYMHSTDLSKYEEIRSKGVWLQVNIGSLTGTYSPQVKKTAEKLIEKQMVTFLASDLHNERHLGYLKDALFQKSLAKAIDEGWVRNRQLLGK